MPTIAAVALIFAACLGAGSAVLASLGLLGDLDRGERVAWGFAAGLGLIGWAGFFLALAGMLEFWALLVFCAAACLGLIFLWRPAPAGRALERAPIDWIGWVLLAAIATAMFFDIVEALSPPADADSLAYHFALPKQFLAAGRLEFIPRAVNGAAPLLLQMTYMLALGLGGEAALTAWAMLSGWMGPVVLFFLCRRWLGFNWSLGVALLFLTTPAVLYGAGTGQVETRLALFAMIGAFACGEAVRTGRNAYAVLAGLMAGFYMAAKFLGLVFAAVCGLVLFARAMFTRGRRVAPVAVYGAAAVIAGSQWYAWNWWHTGDPLFPMLFGRLGLEDSAVWNQAHDALYQTAYFGAESPMATGILEMLAYPFLATFGVFAEFESGRTGFGPFGLLALPFAAAGAWRFRHRMAGSGLAVPAAIVLLFYLVWFFSGSSQRIRHLLPVYPLLLLAVAVAAQHWSRARRMAAPLAAALALAAIVQLGGHAAFAANNIRYIFSGESREAYLQRNVTEFAPIPWINRHLSPSARILVIENQLIYPIEIPVYYAHAMGQVLIDISPRANDAPKFLAQLRAQGVTHILLTGDVDAEAGAIGAHSSLGRMTEALRAARCAEILETFDIESFPSRTLRAYGAAATRTTGAVVALRAETCRIAAP